MNPYRAFQIAGASAAVIAVAGASIAVGAGSGTKITASGVGKVKIGKTYKKLRAQHLIEKIKPGCELGGPNTRAARLKKPLLGAVNFTLKSPRKVTDVQIEGGATVRGLGVGATIKQIKAKFPKAKANHSIDDTVGLTLVRIPKSEGGRITFGVSTQSHQTVVIGIPQVAICD
jgi:hypothetical protein